MSLPQDCPVGRSKQRRSPKADLEGAVVRECLNCLKNHPDVLYFERRNTGAVQFQDGGFIRFGAKGAADIWCLVRRTCSKGHSYHTHVEIEAKRRDGKGRLSADQKRFRDFCDSAGIPYLVVTSVEQLEAGIAAVCS